MLELFWSGYLIELQYLYLQFQKSDLYFSSTWLLTISILLEAIAAFFILEAQLWDLI